MAVKWIIGLCFHRANKSKKVRISRSFTSFVDQTKFAERHLSKMKIGTALAGGLAGALTLNLIHEAYRQIDKDAPKIHLIGEEALVKMLKAVDLPVPSSKKERYQLTLAGDIVSNALYFSLIGFGRNKHLLRRGLILSLAAGIGAVFTPQKIGLNNAPSDRTTETKLLTLLWYTFGGLATVGVLRVLKKKKSYAIKSTFHAKPGVYEPAAQQ